MWLHVTMYSSVAQDNNSSSSVTQRHQKFGHPLLEQRVSKCCLWKSSMQITWELVRNIFPGTNSDPLHQKRWVWGLAVCVLTSPPGSPDAQWTLTLKLHPKCCHLSIFLLPPGCDLLPHAYPQSTVYHLLAFLFLCGRAACVHLPYFPPSPCRILNFLWEGTLLTNLQVGSRASQSFFQIFLWLNWIQLF